MRDRALKITTCARHADVIFTTVPDTPDVEKVLFGPGGVAKTG